MRWRVGRAHIANVVSNSHARGVRGAAGARQRRGLRVAAVQRPVLRPAAGVLRAELRVDKGEVADAPAPSPRLNELLEEAREVREALASVALALVPNNSADCESRDGVDHGVKERRVVRRDVAVARSEFGRRGNDRGGGVPQGARPGAPGADRHLQARRG